MSWLTTKLLGIRQVLFAGAVLPERSKINFVAGATVADNPATGATDVTIDASTVFTDATHLATPYKIVKRSIAGSANFAGTCFFESIKAGGPVSADTLVIGAGMTVGGAGDFAGDVAIGGGLKVVNRLECGDDITSLGSITCTDDITSSGSITCADELSCGQVLSAGPVQGTRFKLLTALPTTRVQQGTPVSIDGKWDLDADLCWVNPAISANAILYIPLDLPHGAILTSVAVRIHPAAGHTTLPTLPKITVKKVPLGTGSGAPVAGPIVDSSSNIGAYEVAHSISALSIKHTVDKVAYRYHVELVAEQSVINPVPGCRYLSTVVTYTRPAASYIGED